MALHPPRPGPAHGSPEEAPPALVAVAHGSRDPRSAATIHALAQEIRRQRRDVDVRVSFLDLSAPRLPDVLASVDADGHRRAVVVPLLLGNAFHARIDVPGEVAHAAARHPRLQISTADVLGGDPGPAEAALERLREVAGDGRAADLGVVLASVGSSHAHANEAVAHLVRGWAARHGWAAASAAHATAAEPTVADAVADVRARGARRVAVVPWVLAPGRLPDRIAAAAADAGAAAADPMGPHPALAAAVLRRWAAAGVADPVRRVG